MNLQNLQTNRYLLLVNIFFVIYIVVKAGFPSYEGIYSLMGFMMLLVAGVAGSGPAFRSGKKKLHWKDRAVLLSGSIPGCREHTRLLTGRIRYAELRLRRRSLHS